MANGYLPEWIRTQEQIYNDIVAGMVNYPELAKLKSLSKVSVYGQLLQVISAKIYTQQVDIYNKYIEAIDGINGQQVCSQRWYADKALSFQFGDVPVYLGQGVYDYAVIDEGKKIIKQVSVTGSVNPPGNPRVNIRANKQIGTTIAKLTDDELSSLRSYFLLIDALPTFTMIYDLDGNLIGSNVNSYNGDDMRAEITVVIDPQVFNITNGKNIITGVEDVKVYMQNFVNNVSINNFGGDLYVSSLIDGIMQISGVISVAFNKLEAKADTALVYTDILANAQQLYTSFAGYIKPIPDNEILITYIGKGYE